MLEMPRSRAAMPTATAWILSELGGGSARPSVILGSRKIKSGLAHCLFGDSFRESLVPVEVAHVSILKLLDLG